MRPLRAEMGEMWTAIVELLHPQHLIASYITIFTSSITPFLIVGWYILKLVTIIIIKII
jgi:hypothetical protein